MKRVLGVFLVSALVTACSGSHVAADSGLGEPIAISGANAPSSGTCSKKNEYD